MPIDLVPSGDYPQKQMQFVSVVLFTIIMFACSGNPNGSGPSISGEELRKLRQNMVNRQIIARGIKD
ncbi:MAG TPA: hypothetical protein VLH08_11425, partial [Acidobacteriota bacterium]|nr:hypothetical protein [Acidobacteriota bacterium]